MGTAPIGCPVRIRCHICDCSTVRIATLCESFAALFDREQFIVSFFGHCPANCLHTRNHQMRCNSFNPAEPLCPLVLPAMRVRVRANDRNEMSHGQN